ncbi:MAG: hypothetical protein Q9157_001851 [Trypethelium eluteriae]
MQIDQKNLEQKNHELMEAFKEKNRSQQQVQKLYQSLKAQVMASRVAFAASDDAENTINTAGANRFADRVGGPGLGTRTPPFSADPLTLSEHHRRMGSHGSGGGNGERVGPNFVSRNYSPQHIRETPSAHRTRLPRPLYGNFGSKDVRENDGSGLSGPRGATRQPLRDIQPNAFSHPSGNGYGMTAGLKMGRQTNFPLGQANAQSYRHGGPSNVNLR